MLAVLIWQRRAELRPGFDRELIRRMNRFGLPLLPAGLAIWVVDFADRLLLARIAGQHEVGLYAVGVKIASAMVLVQLAFRTAWPAFAYSLEEGPEARRTFAYVLTYTSLIGCWLSLGLGLLAPWLVELLAAPEFQAADTVVAPLAFSGALLVAYTTLSDRRLAREQDGAVLAGRGGRRRRQHRPQPGADPALRDARRRRRHGRRLRRAGGRHGATSRSGSTRCRTSGAGWPSRPAPASCSTRSGARLDVPLLGAIALVAAYPLLLGVVGFYQPAERRRIVTFAARMRPR